MLPAVPALTKNSMVLRRKGVIVAKVEPNAGRFRVSLFGPYEGVVVTLSKLSEAMEWAGLATSDLAAA